MPDEIHPPQTGSEENLPPENPPPENLPPAPGAPPPAAALVVHGDVKSERELEIDRREAATDERERKAREIEDGIARREMEVQTREEILRGVPPAPVKKVKRIRLFPTILNTDPDDE